MNYDTVASLQRMQQLQQAEAAAGKRLVLKRVNTVDNLIGIFAILLAIPTFSLSLIFALVYYVIKELCTKTCLVKNIATGEKFRVDKQEFKQYKKSFKAKEKEVRSISDL